MASIVDTFTYWVRVASGGKLDELSSANCGLCTMQRVAVEPHCPASRRANTAVYVPMSQQPQMVLRTSRHTTHVKTAAVDSLRRS